MRHLPSYLKKFLDQKWYSPLIGFLACLDFFIFIIPTDALIIVSSLARPPKWISIAIWVAIGSSLGALISTVAVQSFADGWIQSLLSNNIPASSWESARQSVQTWGGWAVWFSAIGPFPVQPGVFAAAVGGLSPIQVFLFTLLGRLPKYCFYAWAGAHAPHLLMRKKQ